MADELKPRLRTLRSEFVRKHLPILAPLAGWVCEGGCIRAEGETAEIAFKRWEIRRDNLLAILRPLAHHNV